jgi:hypothetical protein
MFDDGTIAMCQEAFGLGAEGPARIKRPLTTVYRFDTDRMQPQTLIRVPGLEFVVSESVSRRGDRAAQFSRRQPRPWWRTRLT